MEKRQKSTRPAATIAPAGWCLLKGTSVLCHLGHEPTAEELGWKEKTGRNKGRKAGDIFINCKSDVTGPGPGPGPDMLTGAAVDLKLLTSQLWFHWFPPNKSHFGWMD